MGGATRGGQVANGPFTPTGGEVALNRFTLGFDPRDYPTHIVTSTAAFTVKVLGPDRSTYVVHPASEDPNAANAIVIVRGRWEAIRVDTAGTVSVVSDAVAQAWT